MFGSIGMPELIIILVIALIIFGPRKLPELGRSLGKSIGEFKKASNELRSTLEEEIRIEDDRERPDSELDDYEGGGKMSFLEHLDELRKRIIWSVVAIFVGFLIACFFIEPVFAFIMRPLQQALPDGGKLVFTEPTEAFVLYIKIAAIAGLILASPVVMSQVWLFIAPGLYANEKKLAIPFVLLSTI
jgi:TatA/E family protein of Tat protein translocase